jgi:hypothetical protein
MTVSKITLALLALLALGAEASAAMVFSPVWGPRPCYYTCPWARTPRFHPITPGLNAPWFAWPGSYYVLPPTPIPPPRALTPHPPLPPPPVVSAQGMPPDQACWEIIRMLDNITGHRNSNEEAVRRGFVACQLLPTRMAPPSYPFLAEPGRVPHMSADRPAPSPPASFDDIEPNSRGITRSEVEQAVAEWCGSHPEAPLCVKLRVKP